MSHSWFRDGIVRWVAFAAALLFVTLWLLLAGPVPAFAGPPEVSSGLPDVYSAPPGTDSGPPDSVRYALPDFAQITAPRVYDGGPGLPGLFGQTPVPLGRPRPNPGFTADLTYGAIYGWVGPGDVVTVVRTDSGASYGSAEADGAGFFWTIPYDGAMNGRPVGVVPGETWDVYVNGTYATTLAPLAITGYVDVTDDDVFGNIAGLTTGTPVTVTLGEGNYLLADEPRVVTAVDAAGNFWADFSGTADIGPQMMAQAEYRDAAGVTVLIHVYPSDVFRLVNMSIIQGFADPGATVTATVYITYPTDIRWSGSTWSNWPHGWYSIDAWVEPGDVVEVDTGGGGPLPSLSALYLEARPDAATDQITGWAPAGATVRAYLWSDFDGLYAEGSTVAQPNWAYTVTLPADLETRHWPYVGYADAEGDEVGLSVAVPHLRAYPALWNFYAVAPYPHVPVTYTLTLASGTYVEYGWCGWNNTCDRPGGYELLPGDIIQAEFGPRPPLPPAPVMSMVVADVTIQPDTAGDAVAGTVNQDGFLEATAAQWGDWHYPTLGWAVTTGAVSGPYNLPLDAFDVRDGMSMMYVYFYEAATGHRTFGVFNPSYWETPYFEVNLPYGVGGTPNYPDEFLTVRLYDTDGTTLLAQTSDDHDGDPWRFWYDDFQGVQIQPGYWVEVTGDSGWVASVQVPTITLQIDPAADRAWGEAPTSKLWLEYETPWGWDSRFVPVHDPSGTFVFDVADAGGDIWPGGTVYAIYQAPNGNRVRQWARAGELFRVEFWLEQDGRTDMWGEAQPGSPITITTPYTTLYTVANLAGNWGTFVGDLFPGDAVTVVAPPGADPITAVIPDPLTAEADSSTDEVWGQIGGWYSQSVQVHGWWDDGYREVVTDLSGNYLATYPDVPRGGEGYIRFEALDGYTWVTYHRPFRTPDVLLDVNYGHDWIETRYEAGHTAWITVTDDLGVPKATMEIQTQQVPWWSPGQTGFNTNMGQWVPGQPDMLPGDWVYVHLDNGQAADVQIGEITGVIDLGDDTVEGVVYAGWFTDPLYARCDVWEDNGVGMDFWVDPDGGAYFCDFQTTDPPWDLWPGHDVGVRYYEPDGDCVINVFREPAPNVTMEKWPEGNAQAYPGGPVVFGLRLRNHGDGPASQVIITDTLPANATYVDDSSGVTPTFVDNQVVWDLGQFDPGQEIQFYLYLVNTASSGEWVHNVADSWTPFDEDPWNNHAEAEVYVIDEQPDLWVNKSPDPGDPAAGETMLWRIDYGNNGPVPGGPVVISDTIPAGTTIVRWWSENGYGWEEVASGSQLILEVPSVPGNWGDQVYVQLALDPALQPGTQLTNTVEIVTTPDSDPGNNWHQRDDVWVGEPRWDAGAYKNLGSGTLVPGGIVDYSLHVHNHGNMAAPMTLTDLLPPGTSFVEAWRQDWPNWVLFPPDYVDPTMAVWDLGVMEPGEWINLTVRVAIEPDTAPGTVIENCAHVAMDNDSWPRNNDSCRVDVVREPGPNLMIIKSYQWNWEGQLQYQIDVHNVGTVGLFDVVVGDTLPAYTTFNGNWWTWFWEWVDVTLNTPGYVEWTFSRLEPGWSTGFAFTLDLYPGVIGDEGMTFVNIAEAPIDGDVAPEDNVSAVTAYTGPDLYVEKVHSGGEPVPGGIVTFTVEFGNANRWPWHSDPEWGTHLTDTLPSGMTFVTATTPWNPDERWHPELIDGNTIVWAAGTQWADNTWFFDLVARIDPGLSDGTLLVNEIATGCDSPDDIEPRDDNNLSEAAVTVRAPTLAVSKVYETTAGPPAYVGEVVTYTLTVENTGSAAATGVVVHDTLPAGLTYLDGGDAYAGGDVTWTVASIAPGATATVWFRATIDVAGRITNDTYLAVGSDQGIGSAPGAPVTFDAVEPLFRFYLPLVYRND
ncbi:MAG: DUF11 domain-containing protein [Anaerolineae bacterium]|nr:DUF11 domain-containing protein [Anaerolineae bacterium]